MSPEFGQDHIAFAATASGLYRTRNGGKSWRELDLEFEGPGVQCLAISQDFAVDRLVLAGTEARGLLISRDGGGQWEEVPELARAGVTAVAFTPSHGPDYAFQALAAFKLAWLALRATVFVAA